MRVSAPHGWARAPVHTARSASAFAIGAAWALAPAVAVAAVMMTISTTRTVAVAAEPEGEDFFFTAAGFEHAGEPKWREADGSGRLTIEVVDRETGQQTPCRLNVVGPDGHFYQPPEDDLTEFSLTGEWPQRGKGNRRDKAPYRYLGRFFYSRGRTSLQVPAGRVRVEVFKGLEYAPQTATVEIPSGEQAEVQVVMERTVPMHQEGYFGGDLHLHFPRRTERETSRVFDLLEAEDIGYASLLAYNEPAGPYDGLMEKMDSPQPQPLGAASELARGAYRLSAGQEYRTSVFGHLNLHWRPDLVFAGQRFNADQGPVYGRVAAETREAGGFAIYAHGGYAQEIYADVAQGLVDAVELLQFGVYRGIGREDWYRILNSGYRLPATGASDYPACRFLGDCRTYAWSAAEPGGSETGALRRAPGFQEWLQAVAAGRSFVTTGPLLLLEIDGQPPGSILHRSPPGSVRVRVRVRSEVTPVTRLAIVVNGQVITERAVPERQQQREWFEWTQEVALSSSSWIAARAWSTTPGGQPDAEAHTNPVYVYFDGRAPFERESLDAWIARVDQQLAAHQLRDGPRKAEILAYFQQARDTLLKIRESQGLAAADVPDRARSAIPKPPGSPAPLGAAPRPPGNTGPARSLAADGSLIDPSPEELREFLRPVPPLGPREAIQKIELTSGFRMELVAAEPLVHDPIAAAFDEDGQLYVAEMTDYPYQPAPGKAPRGSIRLLRDRDGDGAMDEGHYFAEQLLWPAGIAPWKGGVFVAAPPDIWYFKDTDGDFHADVRERVFTGFGTGNQQAMVNNLVWWLDHKIYGATAGNGGAIRTLHQPEAPAIPVNGRDFRFDPESRAFETLTGTVQFGNTFDDWGNRFVCSESQPLQQIVLPQHYLQRNPFLVVPAAIKNLLPGPVPIFRTSPVERWRHIRSSRRIAKQERAATAPGASHHVIDAAAGVTVYRGGAYPPEYYGSVFIADGQNNLVHRRRLVPEGITFQAPRGEEGTEFARSSDIWFRPVNFVNAPDGTLYCLDMSREVLETIHIPLDVARHLDLTQGRDRGRIYRIAPPGFRSPPPPRLSQAPTAELVAALESPHGWWRDTAHRLLYERQDLTAVPLLEQLVRRSSLPQARLHALWSLHGLEQLSEDLLQLGLQDPSAGIRENAVRLAEPRLDRSPEIRQRVLRLAEDDAARVRFQVALSLGENRSEEAASTLAELSLRDAGDPWLRPALLSSMGQTGGLVFTQLARNEEFARSSAGLSFLEEILRAVGARGEPDEVRRVLDEMANRAGSGELANRWLAALSEGLQRQNQRLPQELSAGAHDWLETVLDHTLTTARDSQAEAAVRVGAIQTLGGFTQPEARQCLQALLDPPHPAAVQVAALRALALAGDEQLSERMLAAWPQAVPEFREALMDQLLSRPVWTRDYLARAAEEASLLAPLGPQRRERLLHHAQPEIRAAARRLLAQAGTASRAQVVAQYQAALALPADPERGRQVFARTCAACHRVGNQGHPIGPDLASTAARDAQALLTHILDPNQNVLPQFQQYRIVDQEGRIYTGLIAAQTATSVTLKREQNITETLLRTQIEELAGLNRSLMPEGLEQTISLPEMADLVGYLQTVAARGADDLQARDVGTLPGLIEPE